LAQPGPIDTDDEDLLIRILRSAGLAREGKFVSGMIEAEMRDRLIAAPYQFDLFGRQVQSIDAPVSLTCNCLVGWRGSLSGTARNKNHNDSENQRQRYSGRLQ